MTMVGEESLRSIDGKKYRQVQVRTRSGTSQSHVTNICYRFAFLIDIGKGLNVRVNYVTKLIQSFRSGEVPWEVFRISLPPNPSLHNLLSPDLNYVNRLMVGISEQLTFDSTTFYISN